MDEAVGGMPASHAVVQREYLPCRVPDNADGDAMSGFLRNSDAGAAMGPTRELTAPRHRGRLPGLPELVEGRGVPERPRAA